MIQCLVVSFHSISLIVSNEQIGIVLDTLCVLFAIEHTLVGFRESISLVVRAGTKVDHVVVAVVSSAKI